MENTHEHISHLIRSLAEHTGRSPSTISRLVSGSGDTLKRLEARHKGQPVHKITTDRAARITLNLSEMWAPDLEWPRHIPRPPKPKKEAA